MPFQRKNEKLLSKGEFRMLCCSNANEKKLGIFFNDPKKQGDFLKNCIMIFTALLRDSEIMYNYYTEINTLLNDIECGEIYAIVAIHKKRELEKLLRYELQNVKAQEKVFPVCVDFFPDDQVIRIMDVIKQLWYGI